MNTKTINVMEALVSTGIKNGNKITTSTITDLLELVDFDASFIDSIYEEFEKHNIKVIDDVNTYNPDNGSSTSLESSGIYDPIHDYLKEISKYDVLTPEQEMLYAKRSKEGDKVAKQILITRNLRLVVSIAKKYIPHTRSMQLMDIIQEGNLGLIKAIDKFDPHKGFKLSTYATWWIRQAISRAISDTDRIVRLPVHLLEEANAMTKILKQYEREHGDEAPDEYVANELGCSVERVSLLKKYIVDTVSLDVPIGDDEDSVLADFIKDESTETPEETAMNRELHDILEDMLSLLTDREAEIMKLRYGMNDENRCYTLEEIGKKFGLSRERIRQIESKTMRKMRGFSKKKRGMSKFDGYVDTDNTELSSNGRVSLPSYETQQKVLHSKFDIDVHKRTFVDYLEVIIDSRGIIHYAVPSHQMWLINRACYILGITKEELDARYIKASKSSPITIMDYLTTITNCICVWGRGYSGIVNDAQRYALSKLKSAQLYYGTIPKKSI